MNANTNAAPTPAARRGSRWLPRTLASRLSLILLSGLLIAHHGKGYYVYTGLAFFRQLPAGVPGAYRLLANLVSLGK